MESADRSRPSAVAPLAATLALAVGLPTALLLLASARWTALAAGAAAWGLAVALKRAAVPSLRRIARLPATSRRASALHGAWSALAELALAAGFFAAASPLAAVDVVAFGVGAAVAEILYVIGGGVLAPEPGAERAWAAGAARSACVRWALFLERAATTALHVGTRGLVYLAVARPDAPAALLAFASFAAVDGVAAHGLARGWSWFEPRVCRRFYAFVALVALLDCAAFAAGLAGR